MMPAPVSKAALLRLAAASLLALAPSACKRNEAKADAAPKAAPASPAPTAPTTPAPAQAAMKPVAGVEATGPAGEQLYVGELAALSTIDLMSSVGGRLVAVHKRIGDAVKKGEVVAQVDDEEIRKQLREGEVAVAAAKAQVARAQSEIARVRAEVARAKVEVARSKRERERNEPLRRRGVIPEATWDQIVTANDAAVAALEAGRAGVHAAEAARDAAKVAVEQAEARIVTGRVQLKNTRVRAPFDGRVNFRYLDPGAFLVTMNPRAILQVVSSDEIVARFKVPERDLRAMTEDRPITVRVDAFPGETFAGKVTRVAAALEPSTRSVLVEATVEDPSGRLKSGMFARIGVDWKR